MVMPSRASMETVKAVWCRERLVCDINSSPSWSERSCGIAMQISPRPNLAMKLIASGVAICEGIMRSPSFSRSSASTRTIILPLRASSMISSVGDRYWLYSDICVSFGVFEARNVARQHINFQIDPVARARRPPACHALGVRDEVNAECVALDLIDRERCAIERD